MKPMPVRVEKNARLEAQLNLKKYINIIQQLDYPKHKILLHINSVTDLYTRTNSCKKEPETIEWLEHNLKCGDIFYDIGANIGAYSLVATKVSGGKANIYAFEPSYSNFSQLCRNIFINNCQESIIPLNIALSDNIGITWFNYSELETGAAAHALGEPLDYLGEKFKPTNRHMTLSQTIDNLVAYIGIPNLLKIDVDGIEFNILKGAKKTLSNYFLRTILVEVVDKTEKEITAFLVSKGFKLKSRHKYSYGISQSTNCIFHRG